MGRAPGACNGFGIVNDSVTLRAPPTPGGVSFYEGYKTGLLSGDRFYRGYNAGTVVRAATGRIPAGAGRVAPVSGLIVLAINLPTTLTSGDRRRVGVIGGRFACYRTIVFTRFFVETGTLRITPSESMTVGFDSACVRTIVGRTAGAVPSARSFFTSVFCRETALCSDVMVGDGSPVVSIIRILARVVRGRVISKICVPISDGRFECFNNVFRGVTVGARLMDLFRYVGSYASSAVRRLGRCLGSLKWKKLGVSVPEGVAIGYSGYKTRVRIAIFRDMGASCTTSIIREVVDNSLFDTGYPGYNFISRLRCSILCRSMGRNTVV